MTETPPPEDIIALAKKLKAALLKKDAAAMARVASAYTSMYERIKPAIEALSLKVATEGAMTAGQIIRLQQYKRLLDAVEREAAAYNGFIKIELSTIARDAINQANKDNRLLVGKALSDYGIINAEFRVLDPRVIERLVGFLQPEGALYKRLDEVFGNLAKKVSGKIVEGIGDKVSGTLIKGIGVGQGPRETARQIKNIIGENAEKITAEIRDILGGALTDALRNTRTVQLWSYREASRANYVANSDIIQGWVWVSARDETTCDLCWAEDGGIHPLDESLDGHYNCRCFMVPYFGPEFASPLEKTGAEAFAELSKENQLAV
jgi:DNA-directed RNA polymerase beta' subunit